ncbi:cytochrome P450 monooxygenase [Microbacterium mangrovi]|uniref:Cytochrome P450 monooxygenase n=1 Tax=Microbacterium mangrovi TaxID=1348253 RepID=A0A0B2AA94_9MICO|nr:cytochrome P450 [Microbacterium mangrovi]KHL00090.1 cytochrome P450 monooxygenase [Microbacterium mangrovi]
MTSIEAPVADWVTIPDLYRDPFPIYERLRAEGGVHWVPEVGRYLITSYQAVHETELAQDLYSADEEGSLQIRAMGHSMLRRDDPEHYLERKAWQPVLRPGVVKRTWTAMFRRNAERYLDEMIAKGPDADLIWDFAAPYSAENLRQILGLRNATQEDLQRWSQTLINATANYADDPEVWAEGERSFAEVDAALDEILPWHLANPNESLLSTLLRIPDYDMPMERIRANIKMTIGGGLNEPRDALGVAAWAMLTHPDQRAAATADPALWHTVFDESLRWIAPIGLYSRQVTRDTVLCGVRLPAGARLGICVLSANRDENVWTDADRFDIHRDVKPHLAFSKGVHVCLGAWVARAEVADVALPMLFERLDGLASCPTRATEIGGWVFRGMTNMPVVWDAVRDAGPAAAAPVASGARDVAPRVAIVGSGPSGCFTAQSLRRALPAASVEVFDELPAPYGLVRYGVAADHQGTKSVARQFDRLFTVEGVRFRGNVRVGTDVTLDELRRAYDAVVLATGLHADAALPVPGGSLERVHGAGRITRLLNGHPDEGTAPALGATVAVIGHGNVALDVARLLSRDAEGLVGSDIADDAHVRLARGIRAIHLIGRSPVASAKFDPVMVRELAGLPGIRHVVHGAGDLPGDGKDARVDAVRSLLETDPGGERLRIEWWFGHAPVRVEGPDRVTAMVVAGPEGEVSLPVDDVITAVGFAAAPGTLVEPGTTDDGRIEPGLYTAGWLRRGPRGTIPDQRVDARALARTITDDVASGAVGATAEGLADLPGETDFDGWRRIDLRERLGATPDRERVKLTSRAALLDAAREASLTLPPEPAAGVGLSTETPVTILFATESGGAELVAQELEGVLGDGADVRVQDLADTAPGDLDPARMHLVVSATYGDGEVPTSARPFHAALAGAELAGLRYAVFGMGDRSYTKTYSRGSELIDEALAAAGAVRVGEYGRHDASGPISAAEVAVEWLQGVLAELATVDAERVAV